MKIAVTIFTVLLLMMSIVSCACNSEVHKHTFGKWDIQIQPTCTDDGVLVRKCECGHEDTMEVAALTHTYDSGIVVEAASCTERGLKRYTCKLCGKIQEKIMDTVSHTVGETYDVITEETHAKRCTVCSKITKEEEHYFYSGKCVACNTHANG